MLRRFSSRQRVGKQPVSEYVIMNVLRQTLPRKNNFGPINYGELVEEARFFGVNTRAQFRRLMLRHRRKLIKIDGEPLDAIHERIYREDLGNETFVDLLRRNRWFSWEALTRIALELEFGDAYRIFSEKRDLI